MVLRLLDEVRCRKCSTLEVAQSKSGSNIYVSRSRNGDKGLNGEGGGIDRFLCCGKPGTQVRAPIHTKWGCVAFDVVEDL